MADARVSAKLHVLVAAVTAAERGQPMPTVRELHEIIGGSEHGVTMALLRLEKDGIIRRHGRGRGRRVEIVATGASTVVP